MVEYTVKKYLLGIDIGTSSCKVAIFDAEGKVVIQHSADYPLYYPAEGWVEQDPDEWWQAITISICYCLEHSKVKSDEIAGIGIAGQGWSAIPVDRDGNSLRKTPIWLDIRAREVMKEYKSQVTEEEIFELSGNAWSASYTTPKLLWYKKNEPELFEKTYKFLQSNSYIALRLTGVFSADRCQNYGLHFYDPVTYTYNEQMAKKLGLALEKFPPIYECHEVIGTVTEQAAKLTGLCLGTPVVAGGLDAACGTLGAGVVTVNQAQLQGGQAGGVSICLDEPKTHPQLIFSPHVIPKRWLLQGGTVGGGGALRWFKQEFGESESFNELTQLAEKVDPGSDGMLFLPYLSGERSPIWNPKARGLFYGLSFDKTKGHLVRALLEGVVFSVYHNLLVAEEAGVPIHELDIHAMGGAANSELWIQIYADVTGCQIRVPSSDTATTFGAALLAGVGVGMYKSFEEVVEQTVKVRREHQPNKANTEVYKQAMDQYLKLSGIMNKQIYN